MKKYKRNRYDHLKSKSKYEQLFDLGFEKAIFDGSHTAFDGMIWEDREVKERFLEFCAFLFRRGMEKMEGELSKVRREKKNGSKSKKYF